MRVAFHENDEDNSDNYKQGVECETSGDHGNHGNDENYGSPGCKSRVPQTTGLEIPDPCPNFLTSAGEPHSVNALGSRK